MVWCLDIRATLLCNVGKKENLSSNYIKYGELCRVHQLNNSEHYNNTVNLSRTFTSSFEGLLPLLFLLSGSTRFWNTVCSRDCHNRFGTTSDFWTKGSEVTSKDPAAEDKKVTFNFT
jgi:hypothetical protein